MNIIYLTTHVEDSDFATFCVKAERKPNPAGQNFHGKMIRCIAASQRVHVFSLVPASLGYLGKEGIRINDNLLYSYIYPPKNKYVRALLFPKRLAKLIRKAIGNQQALIVYDSLNYLCAKTAALLCKGGKCRRIAILTDDPKNIAGEIQARGRNITVGYYKNPEANKAAFTADGWFRTGDLGLMDAEGNIFIRGRIKSMILNSSGQNIYPEEIEAVLSACSFVSEALVVERKGKLVALVYPDIPDELNKAARKGIPEQIRVAANKNLPAYSKISKVQLMEVPFEKTPKMSIKRYLYQ